MLAEDVLQHPVRVMSEAQRQRFFDDGLLVLEGVVGRGKPARFFCHHPRGCELPPDWSQGYAGPWASQHTGQAAAGA